MSTAPGNNCPPGSADPRCTPVTQILIPGLSIVTTANTTTAVPGQTVAYTVTVTDNGQTPYAGATVTETLNLLDDATYNSDAAATSGAVSYASPVITWTGDLAVGAPAVITYTVTVHNPDTGDKTLNTVAVSTDPGSSCPPGSTTAGCNLTVAVLTPALTIVKTASTATAIARPDRHLHGHRHRLRADPYTGATVTDSLAGVLADAAYNNDAVGDQRHRQLCQPRHHLDRRPGGGRHRDHHLHRHRAQPRHRRPHPDQRRHLGNRREQLPGRQHRPPLHRHG